MQRQRQLERCGWEFFRVRESAFYSNKENALAGLWRALEEKSVYPRGENIASTSEMKKEEEVAVPEYDVEKQPAFNPLPQSSNPSPCSNDETQMVRIGSTVVYMNEGNGRKCQALITSEPSNPEWGTINVNTPIAKALLAAKVGERVVAYLPTGQTTLRILKIY
jgi:hypothetical protein